MNIGISKNKCYNFDGDKMKKLLTLFLLILGLIGCNNKEEKMIIVPAALTNEEINILNLFNVNNSNLILDFNVDETINDMKISFYKLNTNKWEEISSSYHLISNTNGRILFKYEDLREKLQISYQYDHNSGSSLIESNIASNIESTSKFTIADEEEIIKGKEMILICQINTSKNNAIYLDNTSLDELALLYESKAYEEVYIVTISFS